MSRSARIAVAAVVIAGLGAAPTGAQEATQAPALDIIAPALDIDVSVSSLDDSVTETTGARRVEFRLSADVLFAFNRAKLGKGSRSRIDQVITKIKRTRPGTVRVTGFTDAKGSPAYNRGLSRRRAAAVERRLRAQVGSPAPRFIVVGRGEADPVAPNAKPDGSDAPRGRKRNRRVEIGFPRG